ncbi:MAG: heparinase II/III family protein [Bdellovibrionales bacterium]
MRFNAKLLNKVRTGVRAVAYGNPVYQKLLTSGEDSAKLRFAPPDPWPGNLVAGLSVINKQPSLFDLPPNQPSEITLRNLREVGTDEARHAALSLIDEWMSMHDRWSNDEWSPGLLGARITAWIGTCAFIAPIATPEFMDRLAASLHRQWKHLLNTVPPLPSGAKGLAALEAVIYGILNFDRDSKTLANCAEWLDRHLAAEILPDGGPIARNPSEQLHMLERLLNLRTAYISANLPPPESIRLAILALTPALRLFRHGDGGLALFHGSIEETPSFIEAVIAQTDTRRRTICRLPQTGYERLMAGRSMLIADGASPPPCSAGSAGHAGLLSFEFSHGRERIITNCGGAEQTESKAWRMACASTAAHSTMTIEDTNACEVQETGGVLNPVRVTSQRYEQNGHQCLEMSHEGYLASFNLTHMRHLTLSGDGESLRGRDSLSGRNGRAFTLRWHLHPTMQVALTQGGNSALLRTPSGCGWRLQVDHAQLGLEPGIYCGSGIPRRNLHLKINGFTSGPETVISWSLSREKK